MILPVDDGLVEHAAGPCVSCSHPHVSHDGRGSLRISSVLHAEPDFLALAERYPDLAPHVRLGQQGRGVIDFKSFEAAR